MASLTRQDMQSVVDQARSRLLDYVASRQDMQVVQDMVKSLTSAVNQNQNLLRQEENQYVQLIRRASALESRLIVLEREIQQLRRMLGRVANHQPTEKVTERVIVTSPGEQGYLYTSA